MAYSRRSSRNPRSRFTFGLLLLTAVTILVLDLPGTGPLDPIRGAGCPEHNHRDSAPDEDWSTEAI